MNLRMMRRSLARELVYRPDGLLAAKIHLKHVSAATTEGYSARPGGAQAKLPAGPGDRELTAFFQSVDGDLTAYSAAPMAFSGTVHGMRADPSAK